MTKKITIQLTDKELQAVIDLMDYVLFQVRVNDNREEDEEVWNFDNSILQKLNEAQRQAQGK